MRMRVLKLQPTPVHCSAKTAGPGTIACEQELQRSRIHSPWCHRRGRALASATGRAGIALPVMRYGLDPYDAWGDAVSDPRCASLDEQLGEHAGSEVVPWGVRAIGALNATFLAQSPRGNVIVCIIDSGLDVGHPEFASALQGRASSGGGSVTALGGCASSPDCPYAWTADVVGHGEPHGLVLIGGSTAM